MTREEQFYTSFSTALGTFAPWKRTALLPKQKMPLSSFIGFSIEFGKTTYAPLDLTGRSDGGEQEFTLCVFFTSSQYQDDSAHTLRSNCVDLVEQFINTPIYVPPAVLPGDRCRIDGVELVQTDGWHYDQSDTRFILTVRAKYHFSFL